MKKKNKQLIIAAAVLALLAGAFLIFNAVEAKKAEEEAAALEAEREARTDDYEFTRFIEIPSEEFVKIEFIAPGETVVLEKSDEIWALTSPSYDVMPQAINSAGNSIAGVGSSTIVEENVADWTVYGIDDASRRVIVTGSAGDTAVLIIGNSTPTGSGYYMRRDGDESVYMVYDYSAENLMPDVDTWRNRELPQVNPQGLTYIKAEGEKTIEMLPYMAWEHFDNQFSTLMMVKPYDTPAAVNTDKLGRYMEAMMAEPLTKLEFVNDYGSLKELGLDDASARKITYRDQENSVVSLLIGDAATPESYVNPNEEAGRYRDVLGPKASYYARLEGYDEVFTVSGAWVGLIEADPFPLRDSFVRLVNIDNIDAFSFTYKGESWGGRIEREGEGEDVKETYFFNNFEAPEDDFKDIYQDILYVVYEAEAKEGPADVSKMTPEATIRYIGTAEFGGTTRADFYPYNDNFYIVSVDGAPLQFLVGRYQIEDIVKNMSAVDF